tara:strand:+ start:310 stop:504 length:195 start_codon:yes stop_codon:yes gene_type:complete
MVDTREIKIVAEKVESVYCDGGEGALGHPKISLLFGSKRYVDCYYCGQRFAKAGYSEKTSSSSA